MKTELIRKVMVVGSAMLIGIAVCVSVWFFLREHKERVLQEQSRPTRPNNEIAADSQTTLQPSQKIAGNTARNTDEEPLTKKERVTRQASSMFMSTSLSEDQLATPFAQKMFEAMDSPEFFDLLGSDFTEREWNDFMESQGVPVIREYPGLFRKVIPNMELADYEPVVRRKLAELFIAAEPMDLTDPMAAALQRSKVYLELAKKEMATVAWFREKFGEGGDGAFRWEDMESNPAFIWMTDVQRNAASIVAAAETTGVEAPETQASAPSWDLSSVMESLSVSPDATTVENPGVSTPATDALEHSVAPNTDSRAAATPAPGLTDAPSAPGSLPTDAGLEASLKAQFSSERFDRAMSTLERYGPEEGLRRLRENDPEIAKRIENSRHRNREEVPK